MTTASESVDDSSLSYAISQKPKKLDALYLHKKN